MTPNQVIQHFDGIPNAAKELGITYQAIQQWVQKGEVPEGRQYQIELLTNGALKADRSAVSGGEAEAA